MENNMIITEVEAKGFLHKNGVPFISCELSKDKKSAEFEIEDASKMQLFMSWLVGGNPDWVVKENSANTIKVARSYESL